MNNYVIKAQVTVKPYHKKTGKYVIGYTASRKTDPHDLRRGVSDAPIRYLLGLLEGSSGDAYLKELPDKDLNLLKLRLFGEGMKQRPGSPNQKLVRDGLHRVWEEIQKRGAEEIRKPALVESPKEPYDFSMTTPETRVAIDFINENSPDSKVKTISTRAFEIHGPDGVAKVFQGVSDGQWRVRYGNEANAERVSDARAGAEEALKWADNEYSEQEYKRLASVAKEGETEENPQAEGLVREPSGLYSAELLTPDEEVRLADLYRKTGDLAARNELAARNQRYIGKVVHEVLMGYRRLYNPDVVKELMQVGAEAMMDSIKTFDPRKGRLVTYADMPIRTRVRRALDAMVKIGKVERSEWKTVAGSEGEEEASVISSVPAEGPSPEEAAAESEQKAWIERVVTSLPERERDVVRGFFWGEKSVEEIAGELKLTRQRVNQILLSAKAKLKERLADKKMKK